MNIEDAISSMSFGSDNMVNEYLRTGQRYNGAIGGKLNPDDINNIKSIAMTLDKAYSDGMGKKGYYYRGISASQEDFDRFSKMRTGDVYTDKGFAFVSSLRNEASSYSKGGAYQVLLKYKGSALPFGKMNKTGSATKTEYLMPRNTGYKVENIIKMGNKIEVNLIKNK